jgi:hypothetical protein
MSNAPAQVLEQAESQHASGRVLAARLQTTEPTRKLLALQPGFSLVADPSANPRLPLCSRTWSSSPLGAAPGGRDGRSFVRAEARTERPVYAAPAPDIRPEDEGQADFERRPVRWLTRCAPRLGQAGLKEMPGEPPPGFARRLLDPDQARSLVSQGPYLP